MLVLNKTLSHLHLQNQLQNKINRWPITILDSTVSVDSVFILFLLTKNQMAIKKVPNRKGMKQQHFSNPSPILLLIMVYNVKRLEKFEK